MTKPRGSLGAGMLMGLAAAGTTWVAMLSWRGFTENPAAFLAPLFFLGIVVGVTGALARWWRLPGPVVILAQVLVAAMAASLGFTGSPLPIGEAWTELVAKFADAVNSANQYAAPVPMDVDPVDPLLVAGGLACLLLVDALACTVRRVPLAGLPLLTVYSVPVSMLGTGLSWWIFVLTAIGFLSLLFLHENEQISRWGRPLGEENGDIAGFGVRTGSARVNAGAIGGVATAFAVAVPLLIPTFEINVFDFGQGAGGNGQIKVENPLVDLRRDLMRGEDIPLAQVRTTDPDPGYLRISVLNRFTDNEWSSGDRDVPTANLPDGSVPLPEGISPTVPRREYDYDVSITDDFESTWLPTQYPISEITAEGNWRFDTSTMDFIAGDDDLSTAGADYSMTAVELDLKAAALARVTTSSSEVSDELRDLPTELPDIVRDLAFGVTSEAPTPFEKMVALQNWFRENFEYSLEQATTGSGVDELKAFLAEDGRVGYCEQFAASMAVMARVLDLPSRIAIGFLEPERVAQSTFEYSAYDLHAWVEVYFSGFGWVLFDPTPPARVGSVPGYTTQQVPVVDPTLLPTAPADPRFTAREPSASAQVPAEDDAAAAGSGGGAGIPWLRMLGGLGSGAVLVLILLVPRLLRGRQREARLAGGPEDAWREIAATARDLRLPWPRSRSPRETRDQLVELFGAPGDDYLPERPARGADLNPDAVVAIDRIVRDLELLRYSRDHAGEERSLRAEVETVSEALRLGIPPRVRRRAAWWPSSALEQSRRTPKAPVEDEEESRFGGVVEHVG
ncbi:MAG: DUF3488 and transglutaminase-like domain-containing protein [Nocardioides sp.]